jgi:hypothetical protein
MLLAALAAVKTPALLNNPRRDTELTGSSGLLLPDFIALSSFRGAAIQKRLESYTNAAGVSMAGLVY